MTEERKPKRGGLFSRKAPEPVVEPVAQEDTKPEFDPRRVVLTECIEFLRARGQEDAAGLIERKLLGAKHE